MVRDWLLEDIFWKTIRKRVLLLWMPSGFEIQGKTCKLKKSIYGLRDNSRNEINV